MELKELRQKSATELESHLVVLHKEQFSLRMQKATGQLGPTHQIRRVRREIARVNTLLVGKPVAAKSVQASKPQPSKLKSSKTQTAKRPKS